MHERQESLLEKRVSTEKDLLESEVNLATARIRVEAAVSRLKVLGLSSSDIEDVVRSGDSRSTLEVLSPFSGMIVSRDAVVGELVPAGGSLITVSDTTNMWALLNAYEGDMAVIEKGQKVVLLLDGSDSRQFDGIVAWVSSALDERTRTLPVRAQFPNLDGKLRANLFGRARVEVSPPQPRLLVSRDAIQWEGCCNLVFVPEAETVFVPRKVLLGFSVGDEFVVEEGLQEADSVVTTGSFLLRTEIMKESIGAGCCEAPASGS